MMSQTDLNASVYTGFGTLRKTPYSTHHWYVYDNAYIINWPDHTFVLKLSSNSTVTNSLEKCHHWTWIWHISEDPHIAYSISGAFKWTFWKNLGFCPNWGGGGGGGGGSANPKFFLTKTTWWFCWDFVTIRGGSSVPTFFTQKKGLFHEKIICLE